MKTIAEYAKSIFFVLILLQVAPPLLRNIKENYQSFLTPHSKVGRITIDSMITDSTLYAKNLKIFFKDPEIKAILLKIDCPGGVSGSCQALFEEIQTLKKRFPKPIITLSESICASGGYYIACASDAIITARSCLVGSVGVALTTLFNFKELAQQYHIKLHNISAGTYKNATNNFHDLTPEQEAMLKGLADDSYEQFTLDVSKTRKLTLKERDKWADGKIFTGQQALELHMIDMTGSYSDAVAKLKALAPIEGSIEWVDPQEDVSFIERMFGFPRKTLVKSLINQLNCALQEKTIPLLRS